MIRTSRSSFLSWSLRTAWQLMLLMLWIWSFLTWRSLHEPDTFSTYPFHAHIANKASLLALTTLTRMQHLLGDQAEIHCLALTVYFEARGEPLTGQLAVAQVVLARVASPDYPDAVCSVVKQARKPGLYKCQFSAWCDGKSEVPLELDTWRRIQGLSVLALLTGPPPNAPTHYHANYVSPHWPELAEVTRVGRHVFYR